jgi:hypothetical protein
MASSRNMSSLLIGRIQQFQVQASVAAVPLRHRPQSAVTWQRMIEPCRRM